MRPLTISAESSKCGNHPDRSATAVITEHSNNYHTMLCEECLWAFQKQDPQEYTVHPIDFKPLLGYRGWTPGCVLHPDQIAVASTLSADWELDGRTPTMTTNVVCEECYHRLREKYPSLNWTLQSVPYPEIVHNKLRDLHEKYKGIYSDTDIEILLFAHWAKSEYIDMTKLPEELYREFRKVWPIRLGV